MPVIERRRQPPSRWRPALLALAGLAIGYGGFELGRAVAGYSVVHGMREGIALRGRIRALAEENEALGRRTAAAEVGQRVDRQAQAEARRMIGELQAETARQQQELQFYRGLVARQYGAGTLRVQELRVRAEEEGRYRVLITLVQAPTRDAVANGAVTFSVEGSRGGEAARLALAELEPDGRPALPFSLRFFQQIEVPIALPDDFTPASIEVECRLGRAGEPLRQSFPWRAEGEAQAAAL